MTVTVSDIISIVAIVVSVSSVAIQLIIERKRRKKDRIHEFYNQAYRDILINELPLVVAKLNWSERGICGTGDVADVLVRLRHNSLLFKFYDLKFYNKVRNSVMLIEDLTLDLDNSSLSQGEFDVRIKVINDNLQKLYSDILEKCL